MAQNAINKITIVGNKFSAYAFGLFLKYNLSNYHINKNIEIFPIDFPKNENDGNNQNDPHNTFLNKFENEQIIQYGKNNIQLHLFHDLIKINENVQFPDKKLNKLTYNIYTSDKGNKIEDPNRIINSLKMRLFVYKLALNKLKLRKCMDNDYSTEELLNVLEVGKSLRNFLENNFYGK